MKTTKFAMLFVCAAAVAGQSGSATAAETCEVSASSGSATCSGTNSSGGNCSFWVGSDAAGNPTISCAIAFNNNSSLGVDPVATGKVKFRGDIPRFKVAKQSLKKN